MLNERKAEIELLLTDNPETVNFLCSLPEDRYPIVFEVMLTAKLLVYQKVNDNDTKAANMIASIFAKDGYQTVALMAFSYGKIQGKREERLRRSGRFTSDKIQ
jgi:hypothetical protein